MSGHDNRNGSHLAIEIEPALRERIEAAAAAQGVSLRDYVVAALSEALAGQRSERAAEPSTEWSRMSVPAFGRDWDSDADAIYDDLA